MSCSCFPSAHSSPCCFKVRVLQEAQPGWRLSCPPSVFGTVRGSGRCSREPPLPQPLTRARPGGRRFPPRTSGPGRVGMYANPRQVDRVLSRAVLSSMVSAVQISPPPPPCSPPSVSGGGGEGREAAGGSLLGSSFLKPRPAALTTLPGRPEPRPGPARCPGLKAFVYVLVGLLIVSIAPSSPPRYP